MPYRFIKYPGALMERIADVFALFGIATLFQPGLYEIIADVSSFAALLMPILGCGWLAVQMWTRLTRGK